MVKRSKSKRKKIEAADSMDQASAMLGKPIEVIAAAKKSGCKAFRGSRVYLKPLREWIAENEALVMAAVRSSARAERRDEAKTKLDEFKVSRIAKEMVKVPDAKRLAVMVALKVRKLALEIPARVSQKLALMTDALKIELYLDGEICSALSEAAKEQYARAECPNCKKEITL